MDSRVKLVSGASMVAGPLTLETIERGKKAKITGQRYCRRLITAGSKIRISKFLRLINLSAHPINQSVAVRVASPTFGGG